MRFTDLYGVKLEKIEKDRPKPLDSTKGWKDNPLAEPKFREIKEAVRKEAGKSQSKT
jgi:hypothetical protein